MRYICLEMRKIIKKHASGSTHIAIEDGSKHAKVRNLRTGDWLPVAGSPSDHRSVKNFENSLRRLVEAGQGVIFSKTGHMPVLA